MIASLLTGLTQLFTGGQAHWTGCLPEKKQRIYFANHTSNLDFVLLWAMLPPDLRRQTRPIAARDYWEPDPLRRYLAHHVFRAILIERKHVTRTNNPLDQMKEALGQGDSLIIFPEGGRSLDGELKPFKSGLHHIARAHPAAELIPVFIDNLNRVLPKGEILPLPLMCSVTFGAPLTLAPDESKDAFLTRAQNALKSLTAS